jgi:hypothetical protein
MREATMIQDAGRSCGSCLNYSRADRLEEMKKTTNNRSDLLQRDTKMWFINIMIHEKLTKLVNEAVSL